MRIIAHTVFALAALTVAAAGWAGETANPDKGAAIFQKNCASCHRLGEGAANGIGPQLNGLFGRTAGRIEGTEYSPNMIRMGNDGLVWTAVTLDPYIENPRALVSKTRMSFRGLADAQERADLLAYLRIYSDNPANFPEAEPTARGTDHDLDPAILALQGDPEYGEYLASECRTCHLSSGANQGIPGITGWPDADFVVAMHAYKRKLRPHPVMQMMAGRLSNDEIAALAAYFEDLE
jgi:cytochrome c